MNCCTTKINNFLQVRDRASIPVSVSTPLLFQPFTTREHTISSNRIHRGHVATPKGQRRDESQHIERVLQRGDLPVGAVATACHDPGDEGSGDRRPEDDRGESSAICESGDADRLQGVRECDGGETSASIESFSANIG